MIASCTILRTASLPVAPTALLARDRFFPLLFLFLFLLHHRRNHHYYCRPRRPHRHHDGVQRSCRASHSLRVSSSVSSVLRVTSREQYTIVYLNRSAFIRFLEVYLYRVKSDCTARAGNFLLSVTTATLETVRVTRLLGRQIASKKCELFRGSWERDLNRKR